MTALTSSRVRGRITTALGSDTLACEGCQAKGSRYQRAGNRVLWLLGRPAMRVCGKCEREMKQVWVDARRDA